LQGEEPRLVLGQASREEPMLTEQSRQEEVSLPHKRIIDGFDEVAKGLAAGTISRRRALKLTGSALLGGGLLALFPGVAGAQSNIVDETDPTLAASDPGCRGEPAINNRRCPANNCGGDRRCFCNETVSGEKRCVNVRDARCPNRDQCDRDRDCGRGEVCVKVGGCCGNRRRNACVPLCS
jgi:hypothetical protein